MYSCYTPSLITSVTGFPRKVPVHILLPHIFFSRVLGGKEKLCFDCTVKRDYICNTFFALCVWNFLNLCK